MAGEDVVGFRYEDEPAPTPEAKDELSEVSEVKEIDTGDDSPKLSPQEERAREDGWVSLDEWTAQGKDPKMHSNPEQFNLKGELMGRIQAQSGQLSAAQREVAKLEAALQQMASMTKKQVDAEREKTLKELGQAKAEALNENDGARVVEIEELMEDVKAIDTTSAETQVTQPGQIDPDIQRSFEAFLGENKWYNEDSYLRGIFNYTADALAQEKPHLPVEEVMAEAKKQVVENNPNHKAFKAAKTPPKDYNGEGDGDRKSSSGSNLQWSDLDEVAQTIGQGFIDSGVYKNKKEYLKAASELGLLD
jgi:hypothetical protein